MAAAPMDIEVEERQPNAPQWIFDGSIPQQERARLMDDSVAAFKTVFDPEIPCDIYELGLIYRVEIDADKFFKVAMTLTAPGCPVAGELAQQVESAIGAVGGALGASVDVVFDPPWDQSRMSDEARVALDMF
ncbi:iron-sulfur cluster assembly protein [Methylocella sp.]|uniref:iron-sulfur cluster assembly protein n=1 Tax=Methylocella sp. TaxID=1978226 RepID=UPI0037833B40